MRILIVDDSTTMRRIIGNVVVQCGYKKSDYEEAGDGQEALDKMKAEKFDLILTDWNMPVMNGLDLVKNTRSNEVYKDVPIIMITTEGGKKEVITALKAGVNNYIVKPFDAPTLKEKLLAVL